MLEATVARHPREPAIAEPGGARLTYTELWQRSARVAGGLRRDGVRPGDRVAIELPAGAAWCVAFFGCALSGAVAVPMNIRLREAEAAFIRGDAGVRFSFRPDLPLPDGPPLARADAAPDQPAAIFYTSGTTGRPKGAVLTHRNFLSSTESVRRARSLAAGERPRTLISVPLFHVTGCNSNLLITLELGGTAVILPRFEVQTFLRTIDAERITMLTAVPAIYWLALQQENLADFDLGSVGVATYGGAPCPPAVIARLRAVLPGARLGNGFGLTETSAVTAFLPDRDTDRYPDSVGYTVPCAELALEEPDPRSGAGELLVRGANVAAGYWRMAAATAETFRDGWLYTGDLATIDPDGRVRIVDRKKDMVNRGGENVYCIEVENVLTQHPAVFEAAVVGVPDQMMGEKVGAVLVPHPGAELDAGAVLDFARERLADFKVPQYVALAAALPRNANGKVDKAELRRRTDWRPAGVRLAARGNPL